MNTPNLPSKGHARKKTAKRRLGKDVVCVHCGEDRPEALNTGTLPRSCGECERRAEGKSDLDHHHVAGKNNHPGTVPVPVNDHRADLSTAQYAWPKKTLENPNRSPLLMAAGCIRGFIDFINHCIDKFLSWIPVLLERLNDALTERFGPFWWRELIPDWQGGTGRM